MVRLKTNAKKKLNKALIRVEKVVVMEIRKNIDQQRKRKMAAMKTKARAASPFDVIAKQPAKK